MSSAKRAPLNLLCLTKTWCQRSSLCQQRLCVKDVAVLGNCIKDVPLSAEAAERISLFLLFLLLLAEVTTPAGSRLQVQQTKRGRDTCQSQGELPRLRNPRPCLHFPLRENGDRGRFLGEDVPETRAYTLSGLQGPTTVSSVQRSSCAGGSGSWTTS